MCTPSGPAGPTNQVDATTANNVNTFNGASGAEGSSGAAAGGSSGGAGGGTAFAALFAIQAVQSALGTYGGHQNFKAQQYVNDVRSTILRENANLGLKAANQAQGEAEASDRTAEGVDTLVAKVNALRTRSAIKVSQGENGGSGVTQGEVLGNADRIAAAQEGVLAMNYDSRRKERLAQRRSISNNYLNALAGANSPYLPDPTSLGATGLEIAGKGLNTYVDYQLANREGASRAQGAA